MKKRIITGIVLAFILIPLVFVPELRRLLQIVIFLFSVVAALEMINMCEKTKKMNIVVKCLVVLGTILLYMGIVNDDPNSKFSVISEFMHNINFKIGVITTLTLTCALIFACQIFVKDFDASDVGRCLMIIFYVSLSFASLTVLLFNGMRFIIYLFIVCVFTDIFAYVFGMNFGKHKMCPTISPKKSWEGAIGGTIVGTLAGSLFAIFYIDFGHYFVADSEPIKFFYSIFDYEAIHPAVMVICIIILTLLVSISAQIGDLICSKFKRTYEIKDFSQIFPGHGGVLDRFDSVLFASIVFLCFITIFRVLFPVM